MRCEHRRATDPRRTSSCVKCGAHLPDDPPAPSLPQLTERYLAALLDSLRAAGVVPRDQLDPDYVAYRHHTMRRVEWGERVYGDRWRDRDMIREALEELPDAAVYAAGEMGTRGRHGDLLTAGYHAYLAYAALRRYLAEREQQDG